MRPSLTATQVDFSAGQITERAARRDDLKLQRSGLRRSINTRILSTGALAQRFGRSVYNLDTGRTELIRFTEDLSYEFLFGDGTLTIRDDAGSVLNEFSGLAWSLDTISEIGVTPAERDVFVTYRNTRPKHLRLGSASDIDPSAGAVFSDLVDARANPAIEGTATSSRDNTGTNHTVVLPANRVPGEMLVMVFRAAEASTVDTPAGWDLLASRVSTGRTCIFTRVATGTEADTVTVTTGIASRSVHATARISGYSGTAEAGFAASDTTNPPSLTPTWGTLQTLWFALTAMLRSDQTVTAPPSSYTALADIANPSSLNNNRAHLALTYRKTTASSQNPGDFTISGTAATPHAATMAIRPITDVAETAKGFDGETNKADSLCLAKSSATSAIVGLDMTAQPQSIAGCRAYGSNNSGYVSGGTPTVTLTLYGKNGSQPTIAAPGTSLGTTSFTDTSNESAARSITSSDTTTAWDYVAVVVSQGGAAATIYLAQVVFEKVSSDVDSQNWLIGPYLFDQDGSGAKQQPYYRYAPKGIEMLCSARSGDAITVTFSQPVLSSQHVGVSFRFHGQEIVMTAVTSATVGTANVIEDLPPTRRVPVSGGSNGLASFKVGQTLIGVDSGAEGEIVAMSTTTTKTGTATISINYPAVVTLASHGFQKNTPVIFTTTGALPTGIIAGKTYYVQKESINTNTFQISETIGGDVVNTSGSQSGTHTLTSYEHALDVIVYKGDNFTKEEQVTTATGNAAVLSTPQEITLASSTVWDEALMSDYRGWPSGMVYDRSRLTMFNFPQVPRAVAWSAIGSPNDMARGAEADDGFLELVPGSGRVLHVAGGNDQFVITDTGCLYIPISEANPLQPGSVAFRPIAAIGAGSVRPVSMHEGIVYAVENRKSLIAIVPTGQTSFPYRTAAISEFHSDLFTGVVGMAAMTGGGTRAEQYLWIVQDDGTALVGKFDSSNEWVGFVPVTGEGSIKWITALGGDVRFNVAYQADGAGFDWTMESLDEAQYLDGAVALNGNSPALRPDPEDLALGRLWFYAGLTVDLMNGTEYLGAREVDTDGTLIEETGDDFTADDIQAGFAFTVEVSPYLPNTGEGEEKGQRVALRHVKRAAVHVQETTVFTLCGRSFGTATPATDTYRARLEGRSFAPEVTLSKPTPGPLVLAELVTEVTV